MKKILFLLLTAISIGATAQQVVSTTVKFNNNVTFNDSTFGNLSKVPVTTFEDTVRITRGAANGKVLASDANGNAYWTNVVLVDTFSGTPVFPSGLKADTIFTTDFNGTGYVMQLVNDTTGLFKPMYYINGLTKTNDTIKLGDTLIENTIIELDTFAISFTFGSSNVSFGTPANGANFTVPGLNIESGSTVNIAATTNFTNTAANYYITCDSCNFFSNGAVNIAATTNFNINATNYDIVSDNFNVTSDGSYFLFNQSPQASTSGDWYFESSNAGSIASLSLVGNDITNNAVGLINRDTASNANENRDWGFGNYQNSDVYGTNLFFWCQPKHPDSTGRDVGYLGVFKQKATGYATATLAVATDTTAAAGVYAKLDVNKDYMAFGLSNGAEPFKVFTDGSLQIQDGTQGNGKVLTSDANGNATWQTYGYGEMGFGDSSVLIQLTQNTPVKVTNVNANLWQNGARDTLDVSYIDDSLIINKAGVYNINGYVSLSSSTGATITIKMYLNGALLCDCNAYNSFANNRTVTIPFADIKTFAVGDVLEIYVENTGNNDDVTVRAGKTAISMIKSN